MMSLYPLTTPLDLRLAREFSSLDPQNGVITTDWTVGVVSPTRKRPGMRQHKSSVPHLHPQEKGCERSANERTRCSRPHSAVITHFPVLTSRRWDLPPRLQRILQQKRNLQWLWASTRCPRVERELNRISQEM
ncbi:hypothetical protein EVAR_23129_1 [Eumeta japonica]|uniref:Uncharacterized protein n=1 Tax=Eumeta variegata TaxID=151549 RepID=A0A4C1VBH3_EUMVA|nr:hypothetical protein EVAR_23129_1 [Eumeta japonica]